MSGLSALLLPLLVAYWPVWRWYFERYTDRSDEPLGLLALLTVCLLVRVRREARVTSVSRSALVGAALATILYSLLWPWAPHAVHALIAIMAVGLYVSSIPHSFRLSAGDWSLLILSLPVVSTLNFYSGYPLRLAVTTLSCGLLKIAGFAVTAQGTELLWGNEIVEVDAPCSGVKMLWFSLYVAAALASAYGLKKRNTFNLLASAVLAALVGNVMRVTSLFFIETGILGVAKESPIADWLHQGTGVTVFLIVAALIAWSARLFKSGQASSTATIADTRGCEEQSRSHSSISGPGLFSRLANERSWRVFACSCLVAAIVPLIPFQTTGPVSSPSFPGWPVEFEGRTLMKVQQPEETAEFLSGFPGKVAVFDDGSRRVILRWVTHETRQLHPSSDCYRGLGFAIKWLPVRIGAGGERWNCFAAVRGAERIVARERIFDASGQSWSDVSAWYWSAFLRRTAPPWWVVTVIEREKSSDHF